ncbi:zinc-finger domain protein [Ehrlichia chaffeensis str. Liberty]|uniref:zinc-finger domain-containing protein n=1 Tax=Ehrlichia chaffeensis TaxID=945 RepID=UPI000444AB29|nr:zinc-finger domain-containing protein [Ehrlichia chaffeensis]AHX06158.1 zinc-finger domain protein [Ehrlichia chaffeensis str. Liberty]
MSGSDEKDKVKIVCCSGEGDASEYVEHPKIYLTVKIGQEVSCPYCSKVFAFASRD